MARAPRPSMISGDVAGSDRDHLMQQSGRIPIPAISLHLNGRRDITHSETPMNWTLIAVALLFGPAQTDGTDPNLMREAAAVRAEIARSAAALRQYTWT